MSSSAGFQWVLCSPDSTFFLVPRPENGPLNLYRFPLGGGTEARIIENVAGRVAFSHDGSLVGTFIWEGTSTPFVVVALSGGPPQYEFSLPASAGSVHWAPGDKAIQFAAARGSAGNIWEQPLAGRPAGQITSFSDALVNDFAWSPDGTRLAVGRGKISTDIITMTNFQQQ